MGKIKAVQTFFYNRKEVTHLHNDVEELKPNGTHRMFRCKNCGLIWVQNLSSPQILEKNVADNLHKFYPDGVECTG